MPESCLHSLQHRRTFRVRVHVLQLMRTTRAQKSQLSPLALQLMRTTRERTSTKKRASLLFKRDQTRNYGYLISVVEFQKRGLPHAHIAFWPSNSGILQRPGLVINHLYVLDDTPRRFSFPKLETAVSSTLSTPTKSPKKRSICDV